MYYFRKACAGKWYQRLTKIVHDKIFNKTRYAKQLPCEIVCCISKTIELRSENPKILNTWSLHDTIS